MTTLLERGSNLSVTKKPCQHAIVFTESEDQALRWLQELFRDIQQRNGVSMHYAESASTAIQKLFDHVDTQHTFIHYLESEMDRMQGLFDDIVDGKAFIAPRGQA